MSFLLGVDVSTTGAKAVLVDEHGNVLSTATTEYPLSTPFPLWSEQSPTDWWNATCVSIRRVLGESGIAAREIRGVGLTGQMHGLVLLDAAGQVLRPAILWNDQRTARQCIEIAERAGGTGRLIEWTGNAVLPGFTAPKLLWVRQNEPRVYERIAHVLLPKDYVRCRLTGGYATEVSDASGTSLFDVEHRRWSEQMVRALDIPMEWLPRCTESIEVVGVISETAARVTGLEPGISVVGGAGDQAAQAIGSGVIEPGVISVTTGTSGVVFAHAEEFAADVNGRLHAFCHGVPGKWHLMGVMLAAGGAFRWFRDTLGEPERETAGNTGQDPYEVLTQAAARAPVGSDGLVFLPYLSGERTPYPDPQARGAYVGLTVRHTKGHLIRALLEGVTFGLRDSLELIAELGVPVQQVRASGGGARSALWRQIQADVFGTELVTVNVTEGAAFGAALLAGVGTAVYASVAEAVSNTIRITGRTLPDPEHVRQYESLYGIYRSLYPSLKDTFHRLSGAAG